MEVLDREGENNLVENEKQLIKALEQKNDELGKLEYW